MHLDLAVSECCIVIRSSKSADELTQHMSHMPREQLIKQTPSNKALEALDKSRLRLGVRDIARIAGVSPMSVSRVLNTPDSVSTKTRLKVQAAIDSTGFVGNSLAAGLATNRSGLVGLIVPAIAGPVFQDIIQAISKELATHGFHVMLGQAGYGVQQEDELLEALLRRRPDGIILVGVTPSNAGRQKLIGLGVPTVETWDLAEEPIDLTVGFSHQAIALAAADYLVRAGCREIAFLGGTHARAKKRAQAFVAAASKHAGVHITVHELPAPAGVAGARAAFREINAKTPALDGIFCSSDLIAYGVTMEAALLGLSVPDSLKVLGLGDMPFSADVMPSISTVKINTGQIASHAAQYIIQRARGEWPERQQVDVGFSVLKRQSG